MMNLVWRYSLDIQHLHYVPVCTGVCLLETCACCNTDIEYIILYHSHRFKNINIVIHVQCIEERNGMKVFI